ncbi:MAG TPA: LCP family protein [Gaiellaceae bacterium]|nr:LCP family protein [Gaiellaceae bacterium]
MRTTLKKGIGRGAGFNGNGHSVLPPGALTPVTLYRQPPPPQRSVAAQVGRFFAWLAVTVLVLACGLVGGFYLWIHESAAALRPQSAQAKAAQARLDPPKAAAIALVIGYDHRAGDGTAPSRSDTMMLIRADPGTKTISLLSFPRDLVVPLFCPGKGGGAPVAQGSGRINSAYSYCGLSGALETVRNLTGLPVNYLISVNFLGFIGVVNKLGGVWMDIDRRYYNRNTGSELTNYANIDLQPGYQHLTGKQALDFVRFRHTDSDLYRLARQQQFVSAARQQMAKSLGPTSIPRVVNTITHHHYIEVARGGRELNLSDIYRYATFAYALPSGHVFQVKIKNIFGQNELATDDSNITEAVQSFLNPDVAAPTSATEVALGRKIRKRKRTIPARQVTLTVLNGNGRAGSASGASYLLHQKGYTTVLPPGNTPANAPNWDYFHSKVYFDPARPATSKLAAAQVARLVASADVEPMPARIKALSNNALLAVVVGSTFHDRLAQVATPQTPTRQPAYVRRDPQETRSTLFEVRKRLPFTLEYPTLLERSSSLDSGYRETPRRIYTLGGQPTVRLTFRTGSNEYWGIQETRWTGAPALADKNLTQRVNGREFDLYYSGSNLHMVVLRDNGATYWVTNTLLNSLSNETMLAIARGLRPLPR